MSPSMQEPGVGVPVVQLQNFQEFGNPEVPSHMNLGKHPAKDIHVKLMDASIIAKRF